MDKYRMRMQWLVRMVLAKNGDPPIKSISKLTGINPNTCGMLYEGRFASRPRDVTLERLSDFMGWQYWHLVRFLEAEILPTRTELENNSKCTLDYLLDLKNFHDFCDRNQQKEATKDIPLPLDLEKLELLLKDKGDWQSPVEMGLVWAVRSNSKEKASRARTVFDWCNLIMDLRCRATGIFVKISVIPLNVEENLEPGLQLVLKSGNSVKACVTAEDDNDLLPLEFEVSKGEQFFLEIWRKKEIYRRGFAY